MNRRLGSAAAGPLVARGQQRSNIPHAGYLFSFAQQVDQQLWPACRQSLRDFGYVERQNIVLEPRWTEGYSEHSRPSPQTW
jgi:hypothetical protein